MARPRARVVIVVLVALVALVQAQGIVQGVRSHARLRSQVREGMRTALVAASPRLAELASGADAAGWIVPATAALEAGLADEFEVFDPEGNRLYAHPRRSPVEHWPGAAALERMQRERVLVVGPVSGEDGRFLSYVGMEQAGHPVVVRLSRAAPPVVADLGEYRQLLLGHGIGLVALILLAALSVRPPTPSPSSSQGALDAYEEVVHQLQARGRSVDQRHEAERERLEQAVQEKAAMARAGELTAGIVHEVRNGLATVVGHARLLEAIPEARPAAQTILQECETLETVVRRFLDFIREESLQMAPFDLGRLLSRVVGRERRQHAGCEVSLPAGELGSLVGDEDMLERALENVVRNALEAAGDGGHVRIAVERAARRVAILVDDDGPGLSPSLGARPRAFFSTKPGGTGLGLPIAEKIVRLHAGEIRLESIVPHGVRARVELPESGVAP